MYHIYVGPMNSSFHLVQKLKELPYCNKGFLLLLVAYSDNSGAEYKMQRTKQSHHKSVNPCTTCTDKLFYVKVFDELAFSSGGIVHLSHVAKEQNLL